MTIELESADALRWYLTGSADDGCELVDPDASLGGLRSGSIHRSLDLRRLQALAPLVVEDISGANGDGEGSLSAAGDDSVTWTPPGGSAGAAVTILNGETRLVHGSDPDQFARVRRRSADALQGIETAVSREQFGNALAFDEVTSAEAAAGDTEYRAIAGYHGPVAGITGVDVWLGDLGTLQSSLDGGTQLPASGAGSIKTNGSFADWPDTGFAIYWGDGSVGVGELIYYSSRTADTLTVPVAGRALGGTTSVVGDASFTAKSCAGLRMAKETPVQQGPDPQPHGIQTIANESTAPVGRAWVLARDSANPLTLGNVLPPEQWVGLWLERIVPVGMVASPSMRVAIEYKFFRAAVWRTGKLIGRYAVANDALAGYELYRGVGAEPDFTAAPWETFASLPHDTGILATAAVSNLALRRRNKYGLLSQNITSTSFDIDGGGNQNAIKPIAPETVEIAAIGGGVMRITAVYNTVVDGANAADTWVLWINSDGTDPDPDVDGATTTVAMGGIELVEVLEHDTGVFADGADIRAVVRTRRTGTPDVDSANTNVVSALADAAGPSRPLGAMFYEHVASAVQPVPTIPAGDTTFWIDQGNNVRIVGGNGWASLYADTVLVWHARDTTCDGGPTFYVPNTWSLDNVTPVSGAGSSDPIEVGSWTAPDKHLFVNVALVHRMKIDVTNLVITSGPVNDVDPIAVAEGLLLVFQRATEVRFQLFDQSIGDWNPYMVVDANGEWRRDLAIDQTLTQTEIEAL